MKKKSFVFMGCKHCGKSTHGKIVADKIGAEFYDVDQVIEEIIGQPVRQYYNANGCEGFKLAEISACEHILSKKGDKNIVISTGGGFCENSTAVDVLKKSLPLEKNFIFVFLRLDIKYSVYRIIEYAKKTASNPLKMLPAYVQEKNPKNLEEAEKILTEIFTKRSKKYEELADIVIDIKNAPIDENHKIILGALELK